MKKSVIIFGMILISAGQCVLGNNVFRDSMTPNGRWESQCYRYRDGGIDGLMVWTIAARAIAGGRHAQPEWMAGAIESLVFMKPETTLARALRICALKEISPLAWRRQIAKDAAWLIRTQSAKGGWGETSESKRHNTLDTAWAIYALDKAAVCGSKIPDDVWQRALDYLKETQNPDGGFGFEGPQVTDYRLRARSYGLTSAAAAAALEIIQKRLKLDENLTYTKTIAWLSGKESPMKMFGWRWGSRNMPMNEYRFWLAIATGDKSHVCDAIREIGLKNLSESTTTDLAEDKLVSLGFAELTLAKEKLTTPRLTSHKGQRISIKPVAAIGLDILAEKADIFAGKAAKILNKELIHSYSQSLITRQFDSVNGLSKGNAFTWWTRNAIPNDVGQDHLLEHMANGNIVLFDLGTEEGYIAVETMLRKMFGNDAFVAADKNSKILTGKFAGSIGGNITSLTNNMKLSRPALMLVKRDKNICAIISALPLARSLSNVRGAKDLIKPKNSTRIMINIILFAQAQNAGAINLQAE